MEVKITNAQQFAPGLFENVTDVIRDAARKSKIIGCCLKTFAVLRPFGRLRNSFVSRDFQWRDYGVIVYSDVTRCNEL